MKRRMRLKAVVAALLAAALAVSLTGCSWFDEETVEEKKFVVLTPLPKNAASAQAYVEGTLLRGAAQAKSVNIETSYAISDVRTQNKTLNAVAKTVQNAVVAFLHNKQENAVPTPKNAPALFGALADDVLTIAVRDVLELQLAERVAALQKDVAEGRNIEMKNATEEELRARVLEQLGERAIEDAHKQYQADATLAPAALARLVAPADDKAILAELAKAQEYLQADRYAVQPTALTLFARADKETDHLTELRLTETAAVTLTAKGVGALSGAGDIPVTFVLTKTVVYSNFAWKAAK